MLSISLNWNRQTLDRTFIEINKEDEISFAQFFRNFKELPLLAPFSDLPLSIKIVIYVFSRPINRSFTQNSRMLAEATRGDIHRLCGTEGRRGPDRLAGTWGSGLEDTYKG